MNNNWYMFVFFFVILLVVCRVVLQLSDKDMVFIFDFITYINARL